MRKVSKRARARELVVNVLALKVVDQVEAFAAQVAAIHLAQMESREAEALALEAVELAATWGRSYLASPAARAAAPPVRLGELAQAPGAALARE